MSGLTPRLVVVGGGILGTMHAVEGARRGYEVLQLERDLLPRGASVRNFGLVWVGGRASGAELELALRARERWEAVAASCPGTGWRPSGSLTLASTPAEAAVLEEVAARPDAALRGFTLLAPEEAREQVPALAEAPAGAIRAALHCGLDAVVEPRLVLGALREWLATTGAYRYLPGREVVSLEPGAVTDATGARHPGDLVVCCPGARPGGALGEALAGAPLRRVRLQMLETAPLEEPLGCALADGDSLRYYPAYEGEALRRLPPQEPVAAEWGAQLLLVQRLGGRLTVGDTHRYEEPFPFDLEVAPEAHLLAAAGRLLGRRLPPVERRWAGVYSQGTEPGSLYHRAQLAPGVVVVTGAGGRGMTLSPAIAEETFA